MNLSIFGEGQASEFRLIFNEIKLEETMFTVEAKISFLYDKKLYMHNIKFEEHLHDELQRLDRISR